MNDALDSNLPRPCRVTGLWFPVAQNLCMGNIAINNEMVKLNITTDRALTPEEAETMGRQLIAASHAINRTKN